MSHLPQQIPGQLPLPKIASPVVAGNSADDPAVPARMPRRASARSTLSFIELLAVPELAIPELAIPELAIRHALDATLETTVQAMLAAYPEIDDSGTTRDRWPDFESIRVAEEVLQLAEDLQGAIGAYWTSPDPMKAIAALTLPGPSTAPQTRRPTTKPLSEFRHQGLPGPGFWDPVFVYPLPQTRASRGRARWPEAAMALRLYWRIHDCRRDTCRLADPLARLRSVT